MKYDTGTHFTLVQKKNNFKIPTKLTVANYMLILLQKVWKVYPISTNIWKEVKYVKYGQGDLKETNVLKYNAISLKVHTNIPEKKMQL